MNWVWFDDKIISRSKALVWGFDEGFLYGQGLFETMRCYGSNVFALEKHLKRLIRSCAILDIEVPCRDRLRQAVFSVIKRNQLKDAYIRLNLSKQPKGALLFVFARRLSVPTPQQYNKGFSVAVYKAERIGVSALNSVKSMNHYFYNRLSNWAKEKGFDEALFLNIRDEIVEGSRTNVFFVRDNKVLTPQLSCGCLPGITRQVTIELLKKLRVRLVECRILLEDFPRFKEAFLTNSIIGIMPLTRIDRKVVGCGDVGVLTRKIMIAYHKRVEKECCLR